MFRLITLICITISIIRPFHRWNHQLMINRIAWGIWTLSIIEAGWCSKGGRSHPKCNRLFIMQGRALILWSIKDILRRRCFRAMRKILLRQAIFHWVGGQSMLWMMRKITQCWLRLVVKYRWDEMEETMLGQIRTACRCRGMVEGFYLAHDQEFAE